MNRLAIGFPPLERAGRLANQVVECAATVGIARREGLPVSLRPDWSYRPYFNVPDGWFAPARRIVSAVDYARHLGPQAKEYLQELALFEDVADEIRDAFRISEKAERVLFNHLEWSGQSHLPGLLDGAIAVHVRHGDNADPVTHPVGTWPLVSMAYYRDAVASLPDAPVVLFSDNTAWCREHFERETGIRVAHLVHSGPTRPPEYGRSGYSEAPPLDWIDLALMSRATHFVIAGSTYSWCAAWLGDKGGQVRWPNHWTGHRLPWVHPERLMPGDPRWRMVYNPVPAEELVAPT